MKQEVLITLRGTQTYAQEKPESIELIIVPLEATDAAGHRLGKGGGYYDRYLPRTKAVKIAAVLRHQRIEYVPHDPHDVPLPYLVDADGIHPIP